MEKILDFISVLTASMVYCRYTEISPPGQFPSHHLSIPGQLPSHHLSIAGQFPSHHLSIPGQFPSHHSSIAGQFPSHHLSIPGQFPSHHSSIPGQFPSHHLSIPGQFPSHHYADSDNYLKLVEIVRKGNFATFYLVLHSILSPHLPVNLLDQLISRPTNDLIIQCVD